MGLFKKKITNEILRTGGYDVRVICPNCRNIQKITLPQGSEVKVKIKEYSCDKCGLKKLKMMTNQKEDDLLGDFFDINDFEENEESDDEELKGSGMVSVSFNIPKENIKDVEDFLKKLSKKKKIKKEK